MGFWQEWRGFVDFHGGQRYGAYAFGDGASGTEEDPTALLRVRIRITRTMPDGSQLHPGSFCVAASPWIRRLRKKRMKQGTFLVCLRTDTPRERTEDAGLPTPRIRRARGDGDTAQPREGTQYKVQMTDE